MFIITAKQGSQKKYASWIADELRCNILSFKDFSKKAINKDNIIIFGSRVHASRIEYLNKIKAFFRIKKSNCFCHWSNFCIGNSSY